jgi:hypothetical protein
MRAVGQGVGQPVRRKEDWRHAQPDGTVTLMAPANLAHAVIVRSPHGLVRLVLVDTRAARMPPRFTSSRAHQELG